MRILKFGGKSLSSVEKTQKICKYIKKIYEKDKKIIIVVSAVGNTTDNLIEQAQKYGNMNLAERELDVLLSTGETASASLFAICLNSLGLPAKSFQAWQVKINTMGKHQNSLITHIDRQVIEKNLNFGTIVIITGFQGLNKDGDITTLGRGGSDTTASALGATFQTNVELYSDFNGVYACDPRDIQSKKIRRISLKSLDFLSQHGSRIISNRAVKIAKAHNINFLFKSAGKPTHAGSVSNSLENNNITIATNSNLCKLLITCDNECKMKFLSKNVIIWLNSFKFYNLSVENQNISILINQSDKNDILKILTKKLNLLSE